jgi:hypothetical protein
MTGGPGGSRVAYFSMEVALNRAIADVFGRTWHSGGGYTASRR